MGGMGHVEARGPDLLLPERRLSTHQLPGRSLSETTQSPSFQRPLRPQFLRHPPLLRGPLPPGGRRPTKLSRRETALSSAPWSPFAHNAPGPAGRPLRPLIFPRIQFKEAAGPAIGSAHGPTKPRLREKRLRVTDGGICGPTGWAVGRRALPLANQSAGQGSGRSEARVG